MSKEGQIFEIRIKKECVDIGNGKPPGFHLWAKDRNDLKKMLIDKNIMVSDIEKITEKGSNWDSVVNG